MRLVAAHFLWCYSFSPLFAEFSTTENPCPLIWPFVEEREWLDYGKWKMASDQQNCLLLNFRQHGPEAIAKLVTTHHEVTVWRRQSYFQPRVRSTIFVGDTIINESSESVEMLVAGNLWLTVAPQTTFAFLAYDGQVLALSLLKGNVMLKNTSKQQQERRLFLFSHEKRDTSSDSLEFSHAEQIPADGAAAQALRQLLKESEWQQEWYYWKRWRPKKESTLTTERLQNLREMWEKK